MTSLTRSHGVHNQPSLQRDGYSALSFSRGDVWFLCNGFNYGLWITPVCAVVALIVRSCWAAARARTEQHKLCMRAVLYMRKQALKNSLSAWAAETRARRKARELRARRKALESHGMSTGRERRLLKEKLGDMRDSHPALRELVAAENATSEDQAKEIEIRVGEEMVERSRRAKEEEARTADASQSYHQAMMKLMYAKLASADTTEGKEAMEKELLEELIALKPIDFDASILPDGSVGVIDLCASITKHQLEQCKRDEQKKVAISEQGKRDVAAVFRAGVDSGDVTEEDLKKRTEELKDEMRELSRGVEGSIKNTTEKTIEGRAKKQEIMGSVEELKGVIKAEQEAEEEEKKRDAVKAAELKEYVEKAPALFKEIDDTRRAIEEAKRQIEEFALEEKDSTLKFNKNEVSFKERFAAARKKRVQLEAVLRREFPECYYS